MTIERQKSLLWGLVKVKPEIVQVGVTRKLLDVSYEMDEHPIFNLEQISVVSSDWISRYTAGTWTNSSHELLKKEQINTAQVEDSQGCFGWLIGYKVEYKWRSSKEGEDVAPMLNYTVARELFNGEFGQCFAEILETRDNRTRAVVHRLVIPETIDNGKLVFDRIHGDRLVPSRSFTTDLPFVEYLSKHRVRLGEDGLPEHIPLKRKGH